MSIIYFSGQQLRTFALIYS